MQSHQIQRNSANKTKKRVGRGGKRGTTSGRGTKGQNARANTRKRPQMRDIIKKLPKLRGYRFKSIQTPAITINVGDLNKHPNITDGHTITPSALLESGIISKAKGKLPAIKLLGTGSLTKKLLVSECQISDSAKEKIEKAGGQISK